MLSHIRQWLYFSLYFKIDVHINIQKLSDLSLWCGFLIAFFCLFRKANVCPKDSKFNPACVLTSGDIAIDDDEEKVLIFVSFSKTNQYMKNYSYPKKYRPIIRLVHPPEKTGQHGEGR